MLEAVDPFGQKRDDARHEILCWTIMASAGTKKADGSQFSPADFDVTKLWEKAAAQAELSAEQTVSQMERAMMEWAMVTNARFQQQQGAA